MVHWEAAREARLWPARHLVKMAAPGFHHLVVGDENISRNSVNIGLLNGFSNGRYLCTNIHYVVWETRARAVMR